MFLLITLYVYNRHITLTKTVVFSPPIYLGALFYFLQSMQNKISRLIKSVYVANGMGKNGREFVAC